MVPVLSPLLVDESCPDVRQTEEMWDWEEVDGKRSRNVTVKDRTDAAAELL